MMVSKITSPVFACVLSSIYNNPYTVKWIKSILFELVPFMKQIKNTMNNNFLEANLTNFNESLHQLTAHLEEHKNQTAAELAQL